MNFNQFMEDFAEEIGGQYSEYDTTKSVIVVPVEDNRYQTVIGQHVHSDKYGRTMIQFASKVALYEAGMDLTSLLEANAEFVHAKFILNEGFLKVEAATYLESTNEEILKEMVEEVAQLADNWEYRLTGEDVH